MNSRFPLQPRLAMTLIAVLILGAGSLEAQSGSCPAAKGGPMPLKYVGGPTATAILPCDLMTRLYLFADDSMNGRQVGTVDNLRGTAYIEREVRRLGLVPAGDSGGYFQNLPIFARSFDNSSTITAGGITFRGGADFTANIAEKHQAVQGSVIYGGMVGDTTNLLAADAVAGKIVVLRAAAGAANGGARFPGGRRGAPSPAMQAYQQSLAGALATVTVVGDSMPAAPARGGFGGPRPTLRSDAPSVPRPATLTVTTKVAEALLGKSLDGLAKGAAGTSASMDLRFVEEQKPGRNVVAILRGSDPKLRGEYVAIGAHNDHIQNQRVVEHDSLKAYNIVARPEGADSRGAAAPTAEQWVTINHLKDSLRAIYPARADSISNGADDDGSGSVSVLEIAEAFAKGAVKPKRSLIFVWHAGEEAGLWGSQYFTDHPTVPRDSIVAQLNMDMVGRGAPSDVTGADKSGTILHGSGNYLQLVGSRRLSTELGDLIESVNKEQKLGFTFDYAMDADAHPQNIYCRSDHYEYARYGIPIVFATTGGHADYHQVTDEPQYIQYAHMAKVDQLIFDAAVKVANLDHRVVVDKPKPDPNGRCQQ
ncbi:MAG: M28 family peptidase [Gemmatimonadota bacterium]